MAAPMGDMLFLAKVSTNATFCFRQLACKSPFRNCTAAPFYNIVRGLKSLTMNPQPHLESQNNHNQFEPIDDLNANNVVSSSASLVQQKITDSSKAHSFQVKYEKAGVDDKRIGRLMMLVKSRKYREQTDRVMLEGRRLITDAIECGLQAHTIFFSRLESLQNIPIHKTQACLIKVPFKDITMWSDVVTSQGVIGVFKKPTHEHVLQSNSSALPLTLICDNIREPGNLGTILRSAVAAQCQKILLTKGCVDLWEPKVLRSGAGAHFHMPITSNIPWKSIPNYLDDNMTVHVADNQISRAKDLDTDSRKASYSRKSHHDEHYPMQVKGAQSLGESNRHLNNLSMLESKIYYEINWRVKSAIVIGGETEGLSDSALEMCDRSFGFRVHIPMAQTMESLNSAVSASVILFEVLRQNSVDGEIDG